MPLNAVRSWGPVLHFNAWLRSSSPWKERNVIAMLGEMPPCLALWLRLARPCMFAPRPGLQEHQRNIDQSVTRLACPAPRRYMMRQVKLARNMALLEHESRIKPLQTMLRERLTAFGKVQAEARDPTTS